MTSYTIAISTMTLAFKAQQVLGQYSIPSSIIKIDPSQTKKGCSYGVKMNYYHADNAKRLLTQNSIKFSELLR